MNEGNVSFNTDTHKVFAVITSHRGIKRRGRVQRRLRCTLHAVFRKRIDRIFNVGKWREYLGFLASGGGRRWGLLGVLRVVFLLHVLHADFSRVAWRDHLASDGDRAGCQADPARLCLFHACCLSHASKANALLPRSVALYLHAGNFPFKKSPRRLCLPRVLLPQRSCCKLLMFWVEVRGGVCRLLLLLPLPLGFHGSFFRPPQPRRCRAESWPRQPRGADGSELERRAGAQHMEPWREGRSRERLFSAPDPSMCCCSSERKRRASVHTALHEAFQGCVKSTAQIQIILESRYRFGPLLTPSWRGSLHKERHLVWFSRSHPELLIGLMFKSCLWYFLGTL